MTNDKKSISSIILSISLRTLMNMIIVFLLVEGFVVSYHFSYTLFGDFPHTVTSRDKMTITIEEGMDLIELSQVLEDFGIVENKYIFIGRVYIGDYRDKIKAGNYSLGPGMSPDEICREICKLQSEDAT